MRQDAMGALVLAMLAAMMGVVVSAAVVLMFVSQRLSRGKSHRDVYRPGSWRKNFGRKKLLNK
jgi:hypothetical protein